MQPFQGSWSSSKQSEWETGINMFKFLFNTRCVSPCNDTQGKVLQAWDLAQNPHKFSMPLIKRVLTSPLTSFCFSIFLYCSPHSCANIVVVASQLSTDLFPKLPPFLCSFITGQHPPCSNYRPKVSLGTNYISFHGRAYETQTRPPAGYLRKQDIHDFFFSIVTLKSLEVENRPSWSGFSRAQRSY